MLLEFNQDMRDLTRLINLLIGDFWYPEEIVWCDGGRQKNRDNVFLVLFKQISVRKGREVQKQGDKI